ncbi:MAG: peptidoglycan DD-metalloendopeptidase family protein [Spirochaetales bacterium]|nr:peptidoglycan DD-metalloendopeptidase family protein [Spirochaetales bacterium]
MPILKKELPIILTALVGLTGGIIILLLGACDAAPKVIESIWKEYADSRYEYSIMVPEGWKIENAPAKGNGASTSIMNYNPDEIVQTGLADNEWPKGAFKMDIVVIDNISESMEFSDAVNQYFMDAPYYLSRVSGNTETASQSAYTIIFDNKTNEEDSVKSICAKLSSTEIIAVFMYPEEAWNYSTVKDMLKSLVLAKKGKSLTPQGPAPKAMNPLLINQQISAHYKTQPATKASGDEVGASPIYPLYMPFSSGTQWTVGGVGYFYGEGTHSNYYNDYYATDWNKGRPGAYESDAGEALFPIADGVVTEVRYNKDNIYGGYGNFVRIAHAQGVETLYGHMSSVLVQKDQQVNINTQIGTLGTTGNSTGPHLHMSFRVNGVSQYAATQARRPSPMWTTAGDWELSDGSYASVSKYFNGITPEPSSNPTPDPTAPPVVTETPTQTPVNTAAPTAPPANTPAPTSIPGPSLYGLNIPNPGAGIYSGLKITQCIEGGIQRVWVVSSNNAYANFIGYEAQNGWCGNNAALRFHGSSVAAGTWFTWCSGYAQGEEYVWKADGSDYAPFQYSQYNGNCPKYQ